MKVYYFPVNGYVAITAESYDEAVTRAREKMSKGAFEYDFGEESVFELEEQEE